MKVFICWLISLADILGVWSAVYMLIALGTRSTANLGEYAAYIPNNPHYAIAGCIAAIIPAIITAIFGIKNYDLTMSRGIIRWTSPLNFFKSSVAYFFKTLFLTGAVWAALITFCLFKCFPNTNFEWVLIAVKKFLHLFI